MRTTTLVAAAAASLLAATVASVAPAAAAPVAAPAAAAAAAASPPPLLYTTYAQTANGGDDETISSVGYDASGRRRLASTSLVVTSSPGSSSINGTEIAGPAATYSPDHSRVAWIKSTLTPTTISYTVEVETVSTRAVTTFPLPAGTQVGQGGAYPAWFADGTRLAMALVRGTTTTITVLQLATGAYTPLYKLKPDNPVESIAVASNGTVAFASNAGVALLVGTPKPAITFLYRSRTDEYCTSVRVRPGATVSYTYLCSAYDAPARQVVRSQTASGVARVLYTGDITPTTAPATFLDGFAWSPSGTALALVTTTVRSVDQPSCTNALTTSLLTEKSDGTQRTTLQTEPTITAQTCRGTDNGDVDTVAWSADGKTVVFLHATKFLGPLSAFAVRPAAPQTQTVVASGVFDLSS